MINKDKIATIRVTGKKITFYDREGKRLTSMTKYHQDSADIAYNVLGEAYDASAINAGELARFERIIEANRIQDNRTIEQRKASAQRNSSVRDLLSRVMENPEHEAWKKRLKLEREYNLVGRAIKQIEEQVATYKTKAA